MQRTIILAVSFILFQLAAIAWAGEGSVTARLLLDSGKPLNDGIVFYFSESSGLERPVLGKFWRVPDFVDATNAEGTFHTTLPDGAYYIAAIKRMTDVNAGPPVEGDYFLPSHDSKGTYRRVIIKDGESTELGVIKGIQRYSSRRAAYKGKVTAIEGKLVRADGSPVEGMLVFAFINPETQQARPQFVSARSDKAGHYRLLLDKGRIVYLKARLSYAGGSPQPGVLIGMYGDEDSQKPVAARTGTVIKDIDITIRPFAQRVR